MNLDLTTDEFKAALDAASEIIVRQHANLDSIKGYNAPSQKEIEHWFDEPLPSEGMDLQSLIEQVDSQVIKTATGNLGPHMYAYVMAGGNQTAIIAEQFAALINQNGGKWHLAPAISEIEKRIMSWSGELLGFEEPTAGVLVSGGSAANFTGLTVARNVMFEKLDIRTKGLFGQAPMTVYASSEVHSCIDKSVETLGIGREHLRKINVLDDFTIDLDDLVRQIENDIEAGCKPFCIVGSAGTVNTGAIDPLDKLAALAKKYEMWFHVDGAYGALASIVDSKRKLYKGIELANSVALDFHKWFYVPFEAGCTLVKGWDTLNKAYFVKASYLDKTLEGEEDRLNFNEHHFQLSRNAKALKVWMTIKAYGIDKLRSMIKKDIDLTDFLSDTIVKSDDFRLVADSPLAISCFQYIGELTNPDEIVELNRKLISALEKDGRVFITGTMIRGEFCLRACLINHRKTEETTVYLLDVIRDVARSIARAS